MRYIYLHTVLLVLFLLSSCGSGAPARVIPSPSPAPEASVREPYSRRQDASPAPRPDAEVLRLAMRVPETLNPLLNTDPTVDAVLKLIYEPLTVLDNNLKPAGNMAEYSFSSDYASVNLTLRNDAIWSDGAPVTAADVIYSVETIRGAPENSIYKSCVENIALCEAVSNKVVKITFNEVRGGSPYSLSFPLIPAHGMENGETRPLGNGLYSLDSFSQNERLTLVKSPYTFRGQAEIEKIEVLFLPDRQTELHAFDQGIIDAVSMEFSEWMKQHSVKQVRYAEYPAMYFDFIGFNFKNPLTSRPDFREAVACALDLDEAVADIYLDHALSARVPVNPASWTAADLRGGAYDTGKARDLFRAARQNARIADPSAALSVRILVNEENDERVKMAGRLAEALVVAEMAARTEALPFGEFSQKLADGDFEIVIGSYNLSVVPDLRFAFHSGGGMEGGFMRYSDPGMDSLLDAAAAAYSEAEYLRALTELQEYFIAERPVIGLAFRKSAVITDDRVRGDLMPSPDNAFANINEWTLDIP